MPLTNNKYIVKLRDVLAMLDLSLNRGLTWVNLPYKVTVIGGILKYYQVRGFKDMPIWEVTILGTIALVAFGWFDIKIVKSLQRAVQISMELVRVRK